MNIVEMNNKLTDDYGKDVGSNKPRYRLVWSTAERENRKGTFADFTEEGIYLRTVTEVRNVEKYPFYPDMWVLEALQDNVNNPELINSYSYEPIWIFGANKSERQPVWEKLIILVHAHKFVQSRKKVTESDLRDIEEAKFLKEKAKFKAMIQNDSEYLVGALASGAAVKVLTNNLEPLTEKK